jgi:rfaE bifunctional protein nucleotidyltransferase chain/domain
VVVGDALLDVDVHGTSERDCPDAPAPVVDVRGEHTRPGGAGLAALLAADRLLRPGDEVVLVTALGGDDDGRRLAALLGGRVRLVPLPLDGRTVCKTRVLADGRPVARLDTGDGRAATGPVPPEVAAALRGAGAVLVSDYGRGVAAHPGVRDLLTDRAGDGVPVVWDPHPRGPEPVPGCRLVTPNEAEARAAVPGPARPVHGPETLAARLCRRWRCDGVALTRGAAGAVLAVAGRDGVAMAVPAPLPPDAAGADTCGAGDLFAVAVTAALRAGHEPARAVSAAVAGASRFVADGGAARVPVPSAREPAPPVPDTGDDPFALADRVRRSGGRLVATGGCFDLLHAGHVDLLRAARSRGDALVVCLNSDASVRRLKGDGRPLVPAADRARVLDGLGCVDAVAVFDGPDPSALLERLRPDVWVKGGDHRIERMPEAEVVHRYGGTVEVLPRTDGRSTSGLVAAARGAGHPITVPVPPGHRRHEEVR